MKKLRDILTIVMILFGSLLTAQIKTITGVVTEAGTNDPIPGVTVVVKGTTIGTITMVNGTYSLSVPEETKALQYSFIGYITQNIPINGKSVINVSMETKSTDINEFTHFFFYFIRCFR